MNYKKMSLKRLFLGSFKTNVYFSFLIWLVGFILGVLICTESVATENLSTNKNVFNYSTWYFFSKNIVVYNLIILTFITLSILSMIIIFFNGLVIGYFFYSHIDITGGVLNSLLLFIPHFSEIIGFFVAFHISLFLSKKLIFEKNKIISILNDRDFIRNYLIGTFLILIGAFMEANITPLFI